MLQEVLVTQYLGSIVATARGDVIPEAHEVAHLHPLIHQQDPLATPTGHENLHRIFFIKSGLHRDEPGMKISREPPRALGATGARSGAGRAGLAPVTR